MIMMNMVNGDGDDEDEYGNGDVVRMMAMMINLAQLSLHRHHPLFCLGSIDWAFTSSLIGNLDNLIIQLRAIPG